MNDQASSSWNEAYIALGSNLGDRAALIGEALRQLDRTPGVKLAAVSQLHETKALVAAGAQAQGAYLNAAAMVLTQLSSRRLLDVLLEIETKLGRKRQVGKQWEARTIDLDLLLYGEKVINEPHLTIPHPRMTSRHFVLAPLAEIAGSVIHPLERAPVSELLERLISNSSPSNPE